MKPTSCLCLHQQNETAQPVLLSLTINLYGTSARLTLHSSFTSATPRPHPLSARQECPPINTIGSARNYLRCHQGWNLLSVLHGIKPGGLEWKKEGRAAGIKRKKRWHGWEELEGKDICRLLTAAAVAEHPLPRRLRRANRDSYKLFTLGLCCGRLPCRASLPGVGGPRRALGGCQREDWRVESGPFSRQTRSCSVKLWRGKKG